MDLSDVCRYYACVHGWFFYLDRVKLLMIQDLILKVGECLEARSLFLFSSFLF